MADDNLRSFSRERIDVDGGSVFLRRAGSGPAVLLLHGYPETHVAWKKVAPALAERFTVVAADLPGYGRSRVSHEVHADGIVSKRAMGRVLADAMTALGLSQFAVAGHDRGGRVAYRLALDFPERVAALAVLDIIPILDMADRLTYTSARQMSHWFWLAQPSTVPETLIGWDPELYVQHIIAAWGGADVIDADDVDEYVRCMRKPEVLAAIGAEYRADRIDLEHDRSDREANRRIRCPLMALWARGGLAEAFGDPMAIWQSWAGRVSGEGIPGGHFMMEESPQQLVARLTPFLAAALHETGLPAR